MPVSRIKERDAWLRQAAARLGIQTSYIDTAGKTQEASAETLRAIIAAFDLPNSERRETEEAITAAISTSGPIEPVIVLWDGDQQNLPLRTETGTQPNEVSAMLRLEGTSRGSIPMSIVRRGAALVARPSRKLRPGYYDLTVTVRRRESTALVICAPRRCFGADSKSKEWGAFIPMHAARTRESWGGGNFRDFGRLAKWSANQGASFIGALPLTACFLSTPFEPSPYSPASRLFWNEYYIDPTTTPEFARSPLARQIYAASGFQRDLKKVRASELVDYDAEMALRRTILEPLAETLFRSRGSRIAEFVAFARSKPDLDVYARFRAAGERHHSSWHSWPKMVQQGLWDDVPEGDVQYHLYTQFVAHEQMKQLVRDCTKAGLSLYLDLPVGVNSDSFDVWRNRELFVRAVSCGAPPDLFFSKGQNWGFPPLSPHALRQSRYRYFRDFIRFQMEHAKMLRLDHIMGLHRLFWIPQGMPASQGAYVRYNAEELYAILSLESHLNQSVLIGENLGTVPPEVSQSMDRHGVRGMYVLQFEHRAEQPAVSAPKANSLACFDTHDTPTFAAFIKGTDLALRQKLGLLKRSQVAVERKRRDAVVRAYSRYLKGEGMMERATIDARELLRGSLRYLGRSDADYVLVALEDLWLEENAQNVPGTTDQHPNWKRKAKRTIEEVEHDSATASLLEDLSNARSIIRRTKSNRRKR